MPYSSTFVITGGTSGLGLATAKILSESHPNIQIVIAGRTLQPGSIDGLSNVAFVRVDLSTHAGTRQFASDYVSRNFPPISALLLNAGYQAGNALEVSDDGIEKNFAVNHVNHSLLFYLLSSHLTTDARIVLVGSSTHDPAFGRAKPYWSTAEEVARSPPTTNSFAAKNDRYGTSKLANVFFTYALADHIKASHKAWTVTCLDPGVMATGLYRENSHLASWTLGLVLNSRIGKWFLKDLYTPEYTAATLIKLATEPDYGQQVNGKYFEVEGARELISSEKSHDKAAQRDLWQWTLTEVLTEDERRGWEAL